MMTRVINKAYNRNKILGGMYYERTNQSILEGK